MNRYLFFFIIVLFIGCDKTEDNIFTQTPDERLKATADEYREALFSAPNGWFLAVDTKKDGAYRLWMSFEENERVVIYIFWRILRGRITEEVILRG